MNKPLLLSLIFVLLTFQTGCRLLVIAGQGGAVSAGGGDNCTPTCEYNVSNAFTETFTATPDPGYAFDSWSISSCPSNVCVVNIPDPFASFSTTLVYTANFKSLSSDCGDASGNWNFAISAVDSEFCGPEAGSSSEITVTQNGCTVSVTGIKGSSKALIGNVAGNVVTVGPAAFDEDGGTTISLFTYTLSSAAQLHGNESWTWSDVEGFDCGQGTGTLTLTRL